jgi:hypothetical protein
MTGMGHYSAAAFGSLFTLTASLPVLRTTLLAVFQESCMNHRKALWESYLSCLETSEGRAADGVYARCGGPVAGPGAGRLRWRRYCQPQKPRNTARHLYPDGDGRRGFGLQRPESQRDPHADSVLVGPTPPRAGGRRRCRGHGVAATSHALTGYFGDAEPHLAVFDSWGQIGAGRAEWSRFPLP